MKFVDRLFHRFLKPSLSGYGEGGFLFELSRHCYYGMFTVMVSLVVTP